MPADIVSDEAVDDISELVFIFIAPRVFADLLKKAEDQTNDTLGGYAALFGQMYASSVDVLSIRSKRDATETKGREKRNWMRFYKQWGPTSKRWNINGRPR